MKSVIQQTSVSPCIALDMTLPLESDIVRTQGSSDQYVNITLQARNEPFIAKSFACKNTSKSPFHSQLVVQQENSTAPISCSPQVVSVGSTASSFSSDSSDSNDSISNDEFSDEPSCIQGQVVTFSRSDDTTQSCLPNLVGENVSIIPDEELPMAPIVSPDTTCTTQGSCSEIKKMKRVRSSSDFAVGNAPPDMSCVRPRAMTFESSLNDEPFSSTKRRRFLEHGLKPLSLWKGACQNASSVYDNSLPTLEEAAFLFGFAESN